MTALVSQKMLLKILLNALAFSLISNGQDVRTGHKLVSHQDILITMKKNISEEEWETHRNLLLKTVNGELGYTVEEIGRNLGVSQDIIESIPLTEEEVETSMKAVKGYLETFGFGTFKGYSGQFPQWFIELVKKIPLVDIVEEESELSVLQASNEFVKEGLITSELSPNIQIQPDWGLVRISHRQNVYDGIYTYPQNPGQNVDIYVIDSGVLKEHQEFKNRIAQSPNFSSDVDDFDYPSII
jgi:subtilisin family serine protease